MSEHASKRTNSLIRWLIVVLVVFFIVVLTWGVFMLVLKESYAGKIFPNIRVANLNVGGFSYDQASRLLQEKVDYLNNQGLEFTFQNYKVNLLSTIISPTDPDLAKMIFSIYPDQALAQAWQLGRQADFFTNFKQQLDVVFNGHSIQVGYQLDVEEVKNILKENFQAFETPAQPAKLVFDNERIVILPEKKGQEFDYDLAIIQLKDRLVELNFSPIDLRLKEVNSEITQAKANFLVNQARNLFERLPVKLTYPGTDIVKKWYPQAEAKTWLIQKEDLKAWLDFSINQYGLVDLVFNPENMEDFLADINQTIYIESTNAKFEVNCRVSADIKIGEAAPCAPASADVLKVTEFQASNPGQELDVEETIERLNQLFIKQGKDEIEIVLKKTAAEVTIANINDLGIRELIGVGASNFKGSPVNRRHNIKIGAETLNGLLIEPNEEFSLINALGEISGRTGYLPELVIKGNKTIPEYGGGLCQIGTTMFRVAINTGLPITERRNHSYRVSYYEPAGTDATIYSPEPDLKFVNDSGSHILIQSHVLEDDNELIFEFWGTSDGRVTSTTEPIIYNIIRPGPTKYIETTDLEPDQKKCTERAHNGADAYFKRLIEWPGNWDKEPIEETWASHYVPWQEVCLIGIEKKATSTQEEIRDQ